MPWAVSGLKYKLEAVSDDAPNFVLNIKLNCLMSVQFFVPETGHEMFLETIISFNKSKFSSFKALFKLEIKSSISLLYFFAFSLVDINVS